MAAPNPVSLLVVLAFWIYLNGGVLAQTQAALAYTPSFSPCPPGTNLIRSAAASIPLGNKQSLSTSESQYVSARESTVLPAAWSSYFQTISSYARAQNLSSQLPPYLSEILGSSVSETRPRLGLALSGGGYRAAIFGAGVLDTLDIRNQTSVTAGLGGLLQSATYVAGLSGGSWLVLSLSQADFPSLSELVFGRSSAGSTSPNGWNTQFDLTQPGGTDTNLTAEFIGTVLQEIAGKFASGFPITFADVWARTLSRHFITGTNGESISTFFDSNGTHGAGVTLSGLTELASFKDHTQPFPIVLSNVLSPNSNFSNLFDEPGIFVPLSNTIYEFNPFETGSFDPMISAFTPTEFLGSPNSSLCVTKFDQLSFVESLSSNLFNGFNTSADALENSSIGPIIDILRETFPQPSAVELDSAMVPNPFFGFNSSFAGFENIDVGERLLKLVDGGEDGETDPLQPLLVQARGVDTIFAIDAPADNPSNNFAEGFSLIASQQRASLFSDFYSFPPVPITISEFAAQNLTTRPAFFGCNQTQSANSLNTPLIIYVANGGPPLGQTALTNTSTLQSTYEPDQIRAMLDQVSDIATQGIPSIDETTGEPTKDPEWPLCLACAVVDRARGRLGLNRSGICVSCLERYCWS